MKLNTFFFYELFQIKKILNKRLGTKSEDKTN
jgi:hypothetical protein